LREQNISLEVIAEKAVAKPILEEEVFFIAKMNKFFSC
jgi:hypothetical protein